MKSKVYSCGAGPGDAGLLTLRGAELLRRADVVIYDLLVNPALLRFAPPNAEIISRGKRTKFSQEQINELMIARAREGKTVERLKGGGSLHLRSRRRGNRSAGGGARSL
ncbi:MAG: SAM-dependent methyltransferase [Limisphaerales bacterium]